MEDKTEQSPAGPAFRLRNDPRLAVPTPYERLRAAYARDLAGEPRLAEWTLAALEARLRRERALANRNPHIHRNRARLLALFLVKPLWRTSELREALGVGATPLYDLCRALREFGLLTYQSGGRRENHTRLTPAGEAWLLDLVEPGSLES